MKKRVVISVFVIAFIFIGSAAVLCFFGFSSVKNPVAEITHNGVVIYRINLAEVTKEYTIEIPASDGGFNTVLIRKGEIGIIDSDCPSHTCINTGFISDSSIPIICIPHRLEIRIIDGTSIVDGVA